jgi:excisionase family DNA binding protein
MSKTITAVDIAPTVSRFHNLSNEAFVDTSTVGALLGVSRATVDRLVKSGELPAPKKFGGARRFNVGQLRSSILGV